MGYLSRNRMNGYIISTFLKFLYCPGCSEIQRRRRSLASFAELFRRTFSRYILGACILFDDILLLNFITHISVFQYDFTSKFYTNSAMYIFCGAQVSLLCSLNGSTVYEFPMLMICYRFMRRIRYTSKLFLI